MRRASREAARAGLSGLIVTPSADLIYLTRYDPPPLERLTALVLRPDRDPILMVPELEKPRAEHDGVGKLAELVPWRDGQEPYARLAKLLGRRGRYAVSDRMPARHLLGLQRAAPSVAFEPAAGVLAALRAVKDAAEIDFLRRAARGADEAFGRIADERLEGLREEQVAARLADLLLETGHDQVAFTIVASGPNGASPHHEPGGRTIQGGEAVVLDFGGRVGGYCSDISRTVAVERTPREFEDVYRVVQEAQEAAFRAVRPGVPAEEVDRTARAVIERAGYGDRFVHRTGHGIGLDEHEEPYIVAGNTTPLAAGMCFSIEPGIYLDGAFGVRIEDIVTVTDTGAERLNHASRDLRITA